MPPSQRISIPEDLGEAKSLREMCAAADRLKGYDTPQVLPILGILNKRAPTRLDMLISFPLETLVLFLLFVGVLAIVSVVAAVEYVAYRQLLYPIYLRQNQWLIVWTIVTLLTILWLIVFNDKVREILRCASPVGVEITRIWRGMLWMARQVTRIAMLAGWLAGMGGLLLPVYYGLYLAWSWLQAAGLFELGPFPVLQRYLGISPYVHIDPVVVVALIGIVALLLVKWARIVLMGAFWALGLWIIYQYAGLDQMELIIVAALAVIWPLQIPYFGARILGWLYRRWHNQIENLMLAWELRNSLSAAFDVHRDRNRKQVANNGASAVCKQDLQFFEQIKAGPVSYWWCPECQDDYSAYLGVKLVRGVLDIGMTAVYDQQGSVLLVNLRAWQDDHGALLSPPLNEVAIGRLADTHEAEMFITQYHSVQASRRWPPLSKVTAAIAPDSNLDENGRRQVQRNLRIT